MPDEINFLPEKEKEKKEKEQAKKTKPGIKFYTPNVEEQVNGGDDSPFPTLLGFFSKIKQALSGMFSKKKFPEELESKEPVKLTATPEKPGTKIDSKTKQPATGLKPSPKGKKPEAGQTAGRPMTGMPEDLGGPYGDLDVNLMPWQDPSVRLYRQLAIFLLVTCILVVGIWGTALRVNNKSKADRIRNLNETISNYDRQLQEKNTQLFSNNNDINIRQREFVKLFLSLPRWSKFLSWLEAHTHIQVYYEELMADESNFRIPVVAPDYEIGIQQWLVFENATDWVESVSVPGFASSGNNESGIRFDANVTLKEGVLKLTPQDFE